MAPRPATAPWGDVVPWIIEKKWGDKTSSLTVTKSIYEQFIVSPCGPVARPRSSTRKGVNKSTVRFVMVTLASRCGRPDLCCWPSLRLIASDTGYSTGTVREALDAAERQGWIQVRPLAKHRTTRKIGGKRPHEYHLMLPKLDVAKARKVVRGYVGHHWDTRVRATRRSSITQFDDALYN